MKETSKAHQRRITNWAFVNRYIVGRGIDIGAGDDGLKAEDWPNITEVIHYNKPNNSTAVLPYNTNEFDFVYSSNCLEHIEDTRLAIDEWLRVCKPGGHLIFTVPDFYLYEGGIWPSRWNKAHRHLFRVHDVIRMMLSVDVSIKKIELIDTDYDYEKGASVDQTLPENGAEAFIEVVVQKCL